MECQSAIKRMKECPLNWMDLDILTEVKSEKYKCHMIPLICGILKNDTNLFTEQKHIHIENKPMVIKEEVGEEGRDK